MGARLPATRPSSMAKVSAPMPLPCSSADVDIQSAEPASRKLRLTPLSRQKSNGAERLGASMAIPRLW
ncbi:hypothetical protein D3C78_1682240 [compost metagenome]